MNFKFKTFTSRPGGIDVDKMANMWSEQHPNAYIFDVQYSCTDNGTQSILIMYQEIEDEDSDEDLETVE